MASNTSVLHAESDAEFQQHKQNGQNKLMVIDFFATWCGPCKAIAPKFSQLSLQFPSAAFIKVDVDKCKGTAREYQISAMPTFVLEHRGEEKARIRGANAVELEAKINEVLPSVSSAVSVGSDSSLVPGMVDLEQYITEKNCLNEDEDHPIKYVFEENKSLYLQSDCDPELIISLSFNQKVKLHSLVCRGPAGGQAPKTIKLFINQPNAMDFDSARDAKPLQEIVLDEAAACSGEVVGLKFVKLQNVDNVTLFLPDNQGDDETTIVERLILFGKLVSTTNMGDFKRVAGKKGESH